MRLFGSNAVQNEPQSQQKRVPPDSTTLSHRHRPISVLFIHRDADVVDACQEELKKAGFGLSADLVLTMAQCTEQLRSHRFDMVIAEYPSPNWKGAEALQLLRQTVQEIPLLFVTTVTGNERLAELSAHGAFDFVAREHLAQLPMTVRRVLNEQKLRIELEEAGKALRHSQSLYRALVDNPAYGICRCDAEGKFLDVNQALVAMLGYASKEEVLEANRASEIAAGPPRR
jgi:PAS domain-containing protein